MTTVEEALYYRLSNTAGVTALVSTRIYPLVAPQDAAKPYLVYQRISGPRVRSQSGASGLAHPRFQITVVASTYSSLRGVCNAVRAALDCYNGNLAASSVDANVFIDNETESYVDSIPAYLAQMDFVIWHDE